MADQRRDNEFGHGGMSEEEKRKARSKGGKNSGGNFANDPERAAEAGRKGGRNSN